MDLRAIFPVAFALASGYGALADVEGLQPSGSGGGGQPVEIRDELPEARRQEIWAEIEANIERLGLGVDQEAAPAAHPLIGWPLRTAHGLDDPGYHGVQNFVDQNLAFPNQLRDYNCGVRTYDTASGNHRGIDYFIWPFAWLRMDLDQVQVVAAAPGVIIFREDGNFDQNCSMNSLSWNAVYVRHADGSIAWYGHLKNGSVTPKTVGQSVTQGEFLGVVGSSGSSTAPHLHFEVYDSLGSLDEPYFGPCNSMNTSSWWAVQRPYYDSAVNRVATNHAPPVFPACPATETPNERAVFALGETVYFVTYYRDQLQPQTSTYRIYRPNGTQASMWTGNSDAAHYPASYWYWFFPSFAPSGPAGLWRFEVTFEGQTYSHFFAMGGDPPAGRVPDGLDGTPLTLTRLAGGGLQLDWAASCQASDSDYEVYEGELGSWTSHMPVVCSTGGATAAEIVPSAFDAYYLVVPSNTITEGSYGRDSAALERPPSAGACANQVVGTCP